jgi:hypothetical protein
MRYFFEILSNIVIHSLISNGLPVISFKHAFIPVPDTKDIWANGLRSVGEIKNEFLS